MERTNMQGRVCGSQRDRESQNERTLICGFCVPQKIVPTGTLYRILRHSRWQCSGWASEFVTRQVRQAAI